MTESLRQRIAQAIAADDGYPWGELDADTQLHYLDNADAALGVIRGAYVPPPPGSDRDKLPARLLAVAVPHMPPYTSTAHQMADALDTAAAEHPAMAGELRAWADRQRTACRITRKQDMAPCQHRDHAG